MENPAEDGEWEVLEWSGGATWSRELVRVNPNDRSFSLCDWEFFRVVGGRIQHQHGYWDKGNLVQPTRDSILIAALVLFHRGLQLKPRTLDGCRIRSPRIMNSARDEVTLRWTPSVGQEEG
jgi:hypothetical protein